MRVFIAFPKIRLRLPACKSSSTLRLTDWTSRKHFMCISRLVSLNCEFYTINFALFGILLINSPHLLTFMLYHSVVIMSQGFWSIF